MNFPKIFLLMRRNVSNDAEARCYTASGQYWPINAIYGQPRVRQAKLTGISARMNPPGRQIKSVQMPLVRLNMTALTKSWQRSATLLAARPRHGMAGLDLLQLPLPL